MWKVSFRNKYFLLPMLVPIIGIISVIATKIISDWDTGSGSFLRECFFAFMTANFHILMLNVILIFISVGFLFSKTISISEFLINLLINIISGLTITLFMAARM